MKRFIVIFAGFVLAASAVIIAQDEGPVVVKMQRETGGAGWLGVQIRELKADEMAGMTEPDQPGVAIVKVMEDSPALKAGLKDGDIVTHYAGIPVLGVAHFRGLVSQTAPGRTVRLDVVRDTGKTTLKAQIGEGEAPKAARRFFFPMPGAEAPDVEIPGLEWYGDDEDAFAPRHRGQGPGADRDVRIFRYREGSPRLGVEVEPLNDQLAAFFGATDGGLLVKSVQPGSSAEKAGLKAGDVIVSVDGVKTADAGDIRDALAKAEGKEAAVKVVRNGKTLDLKALVEKPEKPEKPRRPAKL
ncbi:MAG: PDZ domain-containing protein [Acidobacteria bacterium]|nr:PDZ domain-containing protein [Acidobacteriota bacterium]